MAKTITRLFLPLPLLLATACASATDRLNEGVELQAQGRYMAAAYKYAEAVEKDGSLQEARNQLLIVGDSAVMVALEDADRFYDRDEPIAAARQFLAIDGLMAHVRSVGMRLSEPDGYASDRQAAFDQAIEWYMTEGENASMEGRWEDAVRAFASVRGDFAPTRAQREASFDSETRVLIDWAEIELRDGRPRAAFSIAERALAVGPSTPRSIVLEVRALQDRALEMGTVVLAPLPVSSAGPVRDIVGADLEIALDERMETGPWRHAPPFIAMADSDLLRRELRGLLRGRIPQSPALVGRALDLIGADYGVMVELVAITIADDAVEIDERTTVIRREGESARRQSERARRNEEAACSAPGRGPDRARGVGSEADACRGRGWSGARESDRGRRPPIRRPRVTHEIGDTVTYRIVSGERAVVAEAEVLLVDLDGRAIAQFPVVAREEGPFRVGEFDGDPWQLGLSGRDARIFDWSVWDAEWTRIRRSVIDELAAEIAEATYAEVLAGIP